MKHYFAIIALVATTATTTFGFSSMRPPAFLGSKVTKRGHSRSNLQMYVDSNGVKVEPKVCLITGGSRGLGKAMALELGKNGCKVVINYIKPEEENALQTVEEVKEAGGDAIAIMADCTKPEEIKEMFKQAVDHYGNVEVLVNNAGITKDGLVLRMKPEQWQAVINLNLSGVFYCSQEFFKYASKNRKGRIIDIASVSGQMGNIGQANYSAAKGGVIGLCRSNAREFASRGVTVNCICPGFIATEMTKKMGEDVLNEITKQIPLKRLGQPEEVAGLCRFLALDPAADYMTGHCFDIDGGVAIGSA